MWTWCSWFPLDGGGGAAHQKICRELVGWVGGVRVRVSREVQRFGCVVSKSARCDSCTVSILYHLVAVPVPVPGSLLQYDGSATTGISVPGTTRLVVPGT